VIRALSTKNIFLMFGLFILIFDLLNLGFLTLLDIRKIFIVLAVLNTLR
jgi:hypothetical protein